MNELTNKNIGRDTEFNLTGRTEVYDNNFCVPGIKGCYPSFLYSYLFVENRDQRFDQALYQTALFGNNFGCTLHLLIKCKLLFVVGN